MTHTAETDPLRAGGAELKTWMPRSGRRIGTVNERWRILMSAATEQVVISVEASPKAWAPTGMGHLLPRNARTCCQAVCSARSSTSGAVKRGPRRKAAAIVRCSRQLGGTSTRSRSKP